MTDFFISYSVKNIDGKTIAINWLKFKGPIGGTEFIVHTIKDDKYKAVNSCINVAILTGGPYVPSLDNAGPKIIVCNETGEVFDSLSDAVKKNGGDIPAMSRHLSGKAGHKSVNGFTYEPYVE